jgi:hypothetical protein
MKEIAYCGGVIRFRIPDDWREEQENHGGWMYYSAQPDSGTLRVAVITSKSPKPLTRSDRSEGLLSDKAQGRSESLPGGIAMASYSLYAEEQGVPILVHFWEVAKLLPPDHGRLAVFSYTLQADQEHLETTKRALSMVRNKIRRVAFAPTLGQIGSSR